MLVQPGHPGQEMCCWRVPKKVRGGEVESSRYGSVVAGAPGRAEEVVSMVVSFAEWRSPVDAAWWERRAPKRGRLS